MKRTRMTFVVPLLTLVVSVLTCFAGVTAAAQLRIEAAPSAGGASAGGAVDCRAILRLDSGREFDVTLAAKWSVEPADAAWIDATGRLTPSAGAAGSLRVDAVLAFDADVHAASRLVELSGHALASASHGGRPAAAGDPELIDLRIDGPDEVPENTVTPYRVYAEFSDGREFEVTLSSELSVDPGTYASIGRFGDFATLDVLGDIEETIHARFEFGGIEKTAERVVTIIDLSLAGYALDFDGQNDQVFVPHAEAFSFDEKDEFTIEAWIGGVTSVSRTDDTIMDKWDGVTRRYPFALRVHREGGRVRFLSFRGDVDGYGVLSDVSVTDGKWHHIAAVRKSDEWMRLYVDGQLSGELRDLPPGEIANDDHLVFGNRIDGGWGLGGTVDEFRIWNIARPQAAIRCDMNRSLRGDEEGLVGYWRFDDARGQVARDSSPYGSHGQLGTNGDPGGDPSDPVWVLSEAGIALPPIDPPRWSEPILIPEISSGEDHGVSVSPDELDVYIASERDAFAEIDIYHARRESVNDPFPTPTRVTEVSQPGYENHDFAPYVSANGRRLYFSRAKGHGQADLFVSQRGSNRDPWGAPQPITSLNTNSDDRAATLSPDELFIVFTSRRDGSSRLWTASRSTIHDDWQDLRPITAMDGYDGLAHPALAPDELVLYVGAVPPGGGDFDVFRLTRSSHEADFADPILVAELSSDRDEQGIALSDDGRTAYVRRNIGGGRHGSILLSRLESEGGCLPNCSDIQKLKAKCRSNTVKVTVKSLLDEGTELTLDNNGDRQSVTTNAKGKAKAAWDNQTGIHTVFIEECPEHVQAVNCGG